MDAHHLMAVRRADRRYRTAIPFTRELTTTLTIEVNRVKRSLSECGFRLLLFPPDSQLSDFKSRGEILRGTASKLPPPGFSYRP